MVLRTGMLTSPPLDTFAYRIVDAVYRSFTSESCPPHSADSPRILAHVHPRLFPVFLPSTVHVPFFDSPSLSALEVEASYFWLADDIDLLLHLRDFVFCDMLVRDQDKTRPICCAVHPFSSPRDLTCHAMRSDPAAIPRVLPFPSLDPLARSGCLRSICCLCSVPGTELYIVVGPGGYLIVSFLYSSYGACMSQ
ncbi:hypothetical protein BDW42DRAFT_4201 [Aspergillus taichungensis]|uniref:Uncharacterized protein n=1 Tax=Aspergillus taichungensis TaxID=482145 RepID=A0A2J5HJX4_9EURO|nr:hypothetical protein BDW42DRAFT_4201 [Aspergillus taichungensis]